MEAEKINIFLEKLIDLSVFPRFSFDRNVFNCYNVTQVDIIG